MYLPLFVLVGSLLAPAAARSCEKVVEIPGLPFDGPVQAELISIPGGLDHQKVHPYPNASSYDWWYFDAVSDEANTSITIIFMETGEFGFLGGRPDALLSAWVSGSFENGTLFDFIIPAEKAVIREARGKVSGDWIGTGFSFQGSNRDKPDPFYTVTIDAPQIGVFGTLSLRSIAPSHYPCDLNRPGVTEAVVPHVGWSNAQPDARGTANFTIGGSPLTFTGVGYHDKNWGDGVPFAVAVQTWYWGHVHLGPYSLVFFDTRTHDGLEYYSSYVAKDGVVMSTSCKENAVKVRPYGKNSEYPPVPTSGTPDGLSIRFDLSQDGILAANVTSGRVVTDIGVYQRIIGKVWGGIEGGEQFEGVSVFEQFKFPL